MVTVWKYWYHQLIADYVRGIFMCYFSSFFQVKMLHNKVVKLLYNCANAVLLFICSKIRQIVPICSTV